MRIIVPVVHFGRAGGQRVLANLANNWIDMGHEVTMLAHYSSEPIYFPTKANIIWFNNQGKTVERKNDFKWDDIKIKKATNLPALIFLIYGLWQALNNHGKNYDIVIANQSILTPLPVYFSKISLKKFYYVQLYEPNAFIDREDVNFFVNKAPIRDFLMWLISSASYLLDLDKIVNSPIYLNYKLLSSKYFVPPGIDLSVFYPKDKYLESSKWKNRTVRLGCIGRSEPWKGTQYAIDAYNLLKQDNWDVELFLAYGHTPNGCKIPPEAKVLVPNNDEELAEFYRSLDIIIAPGTIQLGAAHYPVIEGMACGISVVTTGYIPATQENNNAWIVPVKDAQAIAMAIQNIILNPDCRCQKLANAVHQIQEFSWEFVSAKMIDIFKCSITDSSSH